MSRFVFYAVTSLLIAAPSLAWSAAPETAPQAQSDIRSLTDIRIDVVKQALQLTPEQTKYWPAVEEAIRARADARRGRMESMMSRMKEHDMDRDFVKVLQQRADNLTERATGLKKLADAWQPLYGTLTDTQKRRMRVLAFVVLHQLHEGMQARRMQMEDEDTWEPSSGAATGATSGESGSGAE